MSLEQEKPTQNMIFAFVHLLLLASLSSLFRVAPGPLFSQAVCAESQYWHVAACSPSPTGMQRRGVMKPGRIRVHMHREQTGLQGPKGEKKGTGSLKTNNVMFTLKGLHAFV